MRQVFFKQNSWDELSYKFWWNPWGSFCFALIYQWWSPRGHILKSLASKVKSLALASRPQVLENWPVLGPRTALFFVLLKFCEALEKFFGKRFFVEIAWKFLWRPFFFFGEHLRLCPWSLALASMASRTSVLGLGLGFFLCPWPWPRALCFRLHLCYL